jgi:hypothetical protein
MIHHTKKPPFKRLLKIGAIVENVRTIFERRNDATIYFPALEYVEK